MSGRHGRGAWERQPSGALLLKAFSPEIDFPEIDFFTAVVSDHLQLTYDLDVPLTRLGGSTNFGDSKIVWDPSRDRHSVKVEKQNCP